MAVEAESLAAYLQGRLSLEEFEWEPSSRPLLPFNHFANSHLVPEIDLADPLASPTIAQELSHAARSCGFFQVYNHGVSLAALDRLEGYVRRLFALPLDRKIEISKSLGSLMSSTVCGYMCGSSSQITNKWWVESLRVASGDARIINEVAECLWPDEDDRRGFCNAVDEYSKSFTKLAEHLTELLIQGLGLSIKDMEHILGDATAGLKFSHYPPCPQPELTLGLPAHTDVSILTILRQDEVGGLQVEREGTWVAIRPRHDALVVNLGDVFQVWSNDRYTSATHRVVLNNSESRFSMIYFYNPREDAILSPLPQLVKDEPPKFRSISNSEYRHYIFDSLHKGAYKGVDYLKIKA